MARKVKAVLIVGGSGYVGTQLALRLREKYKVFATAYNNYMTMPGVTYIPFDALDRNWAKRVIYSIEPNVIVYAAGKDDVAWAEKEEREAERVHTGGSANLAAVAAILQPKFIFLSNSHVFDGKRGNYRETDVVLPFTSLGKFKLSGENFIRGKSLNYVIVRSSPVFGIGNGISSSFLDSIRTSLNNEKRIELPEDEIHSFAPVSGLATLIDRLIEGGPRNKVLHYGGLTKLSLYQFGKMFAERFGYDSSLVSAYKNPHLKESDIFLADYSLNSSHVAKTLKIKPLLLEEGFDLLEKELIS